MSGTKPEDAPQDRRAELLPEVEGQLDRALALVRLLRRECSWDRAQTPASLIPHLLEESREVVDAIEHEDSRELEGELGDLLLNLAFQIVLGEEEGHFDAASVADRLEDKMVRRHPHIFAGGEKRPWEVLKAEEREAARTGADPDEGTLAGLGWGLDPLNRAHRIQERVSAVGFDWSEPAGAWEKVSEELEEVREALEKGSAEALEEELGDLLFAVVNLTRLCGSHAATRLQAANRKFTERFRRLETLARERGIDVATATLEDLDALWDELKAREKSSPPSRGG